MNIITENLQMYLDPANEKSFLGEPTSNLVTLNPIPTSSNNYIASGGTGLLEYNQQYNAIFYQRNTYESWGSYLYNSTYFNGSLDTTKLYTASFEWKTESQIAPFFAFEIAQGNGQFPAISVSTASFSEYIGDGWYRFSRTFYPSNSGIQAYPRVLFGSNKGTKITKFYIRKLQIEQKDYRTPFVEGTRLIVFKDLTKNVNYGNGYNINYSNNNHGSVSFNGINSYIEIPHSSSITPSSSMTCSVWAYSDDWNSQNSKRIISKTEAGNYAIWTGDNSNSYKVSAVLNVNGTYYYPGYSRNLLSKGWHNFCFTFDGRYVKFYVDSILTETSDTGSTQSIQVNNSNSLILGAEAGPSTIPASNTYFYGKIGPVKIYNIALTESQISNNFNVLRGRYEI